MILHFQDITYRLHEEKPYRPKLQVTIYSMSKRHLRNENPCLLFFNLKKYLQGDSTQGKANMYSYNKFILSELNEMYVK